MDAIAKKCTSEELGLWFAGDSLPRNSKIPLDTGVVAVGNALLSELFKGAVEEPLSESSYQNKSPDSQETLVPDGDFLSCMPRDEEILDQELEKTSSVELSPGQEMAKNFPGLPKSAKKLLRAKVGLETKVMIFVKWLDQRENLKQKRAKLNSLQKKLWKGSKKNYYDQFFKQKISELEKLQKRFGSLEGFKREFEALERQLWKLEEEVWRAWVQKEVGNCSGHWKKKLARTSAWKDT